MINKAFWVLLFLLNTNQYRKKTIGKKIANAMELKNISVYNGIIKGYYISLNCFW